MYQNVTEYGVSYRRDASHALGRQMPSTFGQRLAELRNAQNPVLGQEAFAGAFSKFIKDWLERNNRPQDQKYNFTQQQISKWETKGVKPDYEVVVAAADFFGVNPMYMSGLVDDPTRNTDTPAFFREVEEAVVMEMRINDVFVEMVRQLLNLSRSKRLAAPAKERKNKRRTLGPGKTSQS